MSVTTQNLWFFQENLLNFLKCYNFLWVQRRHNCYPAASFCKLRYDTIPVKCASANVSFYTNNSKMPNFELWHSCREWATYCLPAFCSYRIVIRIAVRPSRNRPSSTVCLRTISCHPGIFKQWHSLRYALSRRSFWVRSDAICHIK